MPSLRLEHYAFRIMENQLRIQEIQDTYGEFDWGADISNGRLTFTDTASGTVLADLPMQLIGSQSDQTRTWLWAWANANGGNAFPESVTRLCRAVRDAAIASGKGDTVLAAADLFDLPEVGLALPEDNFGYEMATLCAGFGGAFGYYRCPYEGGAAWAVIESYPEAETLPPSAHRMARAIQAAISTFPLDHHAATEAYLGQPGASSMYANGLTIRFDDQGRIAGMQYAVGGGDL
ncbi:MAG: hypothetical protein H7145_20795 [Akkermansiaceae bacterium]|nr:hypothetical protein [Armatimonadota bacterium]